MKYKLFKTMVEISIIFGVEQCQLFPCLVADGPNGHGRGEAVGTAPGSPGRGQVGRGRTGGGSQSLGAVARERDVAGAPVNVEGDIQLGKNLCDLTDMSLNLCETCVEKYFYLNYIWRWISHDFWCLLRSLFLRFNLLRRCIDESYTLPTR